MKAVNVDEVLKVLHKYGKYIFVTDEKKYSSMVDEIENIQALEQEPILDKIRAEIMTKYDSIPWNNIDYDNGWVEALEWVIWNVIDKYRAESEGKE